MNRFHLAILAVCVLAGCSVSDLAGTRSEHAAHTGDFGLIRVRVRDSPITIDGHVIASVDLTVKSVSLHGSKGWIQLSGGDPQTFDLLTLVDDASLVLGDAVLPAGEYQEIRLVLAEEHTINVDGVDLPLKTSSAEESGVKLKGPFTITGGVVTSIALDFDAGKSIRYNKGSGWRLAPVINIESVTSKQGAFAADFIKASVGGNIGLDDGASVVIPPGALAADTLVWMERVRDDGSGFVYSPFYELSPSNAHFNVPVQVTLPYFDASVPQWDAEGALEMFANYERIGALSRDPTANLVTAASTHFCPYFVSSPASYNPLSATVAANGGVSSSGSRYYDLDGVTVYDHTSESIPYVLAIVDIKRKDIRVRGLLAKRGGLLTPDNLPVYNLESLDGILSSAETSPLVAVNGLEWSSWAGSDYHGLLDVRTTRVLGQTRYTASKPENLEPMFYADDCDGVTPEVKIGLRDQSTLDAYDTAFGGSITFASNGQYDVADSELKGDLSVPLPRTAVSILKDGRLALLASGGDHGKKGLLPSGVFNLVNEFGIQDGMLLDGGSSTQMVRHGTNGEKIVDQLMIGDYWWWAQAKYDGWKPIISSLVVERFPTVDSVTTNDALAVNSLATFKVAGKNMTGTSVAWVHGCASSEADPDGTIPIHGDATLRTFWCSPVSSGAHQLLIKDRKGGETLYDSSINVP